MYGVSYTYLLAWQVSDVDFWNMTLMLFTHVVLGVYRTDPWSPSLRPECRYQMGVSYITDP